MPPTADELWRYLVQEAGEDLIEEASRVTVAQAERELTAAGFDVAAERRKAGATIERLRRGLPR